MNNNMDHNNNHAKCYNGDNIMDASSDPVEGWTKCNNEEYYFKTNQLHYLLFY